jgi:hypothetical protein
VKVGCLAVVVGLCNKGGDMGCDLSLLVSLGVEEKQRKASSFDGGLVLLNGRIVDGGDLLLDCERLDGTMTLFSSSPSSTRRHR